MTTARAFVSYRFLETERSAAIARHQYRIGYLAFLIAFVTNLIPGAH